ncbi:hypothetical protein K469DRAFT_735712 [Zopfia rhizophila CBS 207.26]|uniref:Uncharacterized protein n=1 Tax=Zopfia rhizophila CBS 207.26 TaxID=1314779 RepID=A0A6A6EP71_9PEZI|nr:hypothetical protein K469DRAFT_735712 [Zopfia rhizophila CBS 207.26]
MTTAKDPFALAIASFISDIKSKEDIRSPFYKEVLSQIKVGSLDATQVGDTIQCEHQLDTFIQELEHKQMRNSKTLWVTDKLRPLVAGLAQYTSACDVMIQAAPSAAVLLYGGARVVLQLAQNFYSCFDTVLSIMEDEVYQASTDMQNLLIRSYKNIVFRKAYKTLLKCRQDLQDDSNRVQMLAQATEADLRRQKDLANAAHRESKLRKQIVEWIKASEDDDRLDIRGDLRANNQIRYENTCDWLFEHPDMENWLRVNKTTGIWYTAPPGAGKTILASTLTRNLQDKGFRTATFFYSFNDLVRRKPITALRCLALQLLQPSDPIPDRVKRLYEEDHIAAEVVAELIKQIPRVHIIVDGLDECESRPDLIISLCLLLSVKTRPEPEIRTAMRKHDVMELEAPQDSLISDIGKFVAGRLNRECCITRWTTKSEGNFLWVTHMLRTLEGDDFTCEEEIEEELNKFPKGLTGCYIRSLAQLSKRPESHQRLARRIFTMIVGAIQPLRLSELSHAVAASSGGPDYSTKRLPKLEVIQKLCSNLVVFDRTSKGSEDDPLIKVAHKSIQDFFLQDPDSLDLPNDYVRQYFVSTSAANLELGQSCLKYLSYGRYLQPQDVSLILDKPDHAFLRHAAALWHMYLREADHSEELFNKVKVFIQSQAFWTCIAVQTRIAPHLFAHYQQTANGVFRLRATGAKEDEEVGTVHYAIPLPEWLEIYEPSGPQMVQAFHSFVREWHPVLNSHPSAGDHCIMDPGWASNISGRTTWTSQRVKLLPLFMGESGPSGYSNLSIVDTGIQSGNITVATFGNQSSSEGRLLHLQIDSRSDLPQPDSEQTIPSDFSGPCHIFSTTYDGDEPYSLVDIRSLQVKQYENDEGASDQPWKCSDIAPPEGSEDVWRLVCKTTCDTPNGASSFQRALAFHCSQESTCKSNALSRQGDSGYGSNGSNSDSDADTTDDSEDEAVTISEELAVRHCMLIMRKTGPTWHFWKSTIYSLEALCAFHPVEELAVWSPSTHELCVMRLDSGEVQLAILPEPVEHKFSSATAARKEFQFSESGDWLYYLLYTSTETEKGIQQIISVSTFSFSANDDGEYFLQRIYPTQSVPYACCGSIQHPLVLTSWSSKYIFVALPQLLCNPKLLRLKLPYGEYAQNPTSDGLQTLRNAVYFPYSTPYRNPQIKVLPREKRKETLVLALDAEISPPMLMTWDLDRKRDWREWDKDVDAQSEEWKEGRCTYHKLRGTFVDADKRFNVPVRSGLDWRKKAFLSCA